MGWDRARAAALLRRGRALLLSPVVLPLLTLVLLLVPHYAGTHTALHIPVRYHRVDLKSREPVVLEADLPPADYQIEPASLGYFVDDAPDGRRQFVYSGDVPRGLIYAQLPPAKPPSGAAGPGPVVVLELAAPSGEVFYERQLEAIRDNVAELNRRRNLLRLAQLGAGGSYKSTIGALWKSLSVTASGIRAGGWLDSVLSKYPQDAPRLAAALADDANRRCEQKGLYYSAEQERLKLMLSQFDLQLGLARVPHTRSADLLSLGDEQLVKATVLKEIDQLDTAWQGRSQELQRLVGLGEAQLKRLTGDAPADDAASLAQSVDPRNLVVVPPGSSLAAGAVTPRQGLERAMVNAWLSVQQRELRELQASLPELEAARKHVTASDAPDWSKLPRLEVDAAGFQPPVLESLRYYAALEGGADVPTTTKLLSGLAEEFEAVPSPTGPGRLPDIFDAQQQRQDVLDGLEGGSLNVAPDELGYGLLALERCRAALPPAGAAADAPSAAPAEAAPAGFRGEGEPAAPAAAGPSAPAGGSAPAAAVDSPGRQESVVALRAALAGQLDVILRSPDDSGLAAYNLAFLKFMRWYAGLSLPRLALPADGSAAVTTQSYGFKDASHVP